VSTVFERLVFGLKMGVGALAVTKKRTFFNKMAHFLNKKGGKVKKLKKKLQNDSFYCVFL